MSEIEVLAKGNTMTVDECIDSQGCKAVGITFGLHRLVWSPRDARIVGQSLIDVADEIEKESIQ